MSAAIEIATKILTDLNKDLVLAYAVDDKVSQQSGRSQSSTYNVAKSLLMQIFRTAQTYPGFIAVVQSRRSVGVDGTLTYAELWQRAVDLSQILKMSRVPAGSTVAIFAGRSLEVVLAALSVLIAGVEPEPVNPC